MRGLSESNGAYRFDVLTLFPEMFEAALRIGVLGRAQAAGHIEVRAWDIREAASDRRGTVDDAPYGGGPGMVLKPEPIVKTVEKVLRGAADAPPVIVLSPGGVPLRQGMVEEWAGAGRIVLICGRYEGIDARVPELIGAQEVSIGDYVLSGGEPAALVIIDAVARLLPGVLGGEAASLEQESFGPIGLEYPQYTRPPVYRGLEVPEALLSGDHEAIRRWRRKEGLRRTLRVRPDLLGRTPLDEEARVLLAEIFDEMRSSV